MIENIQFKKIDFIHDDCMFVINNFPYHKDEINFILKNKNVYESKIDKINYNYKNRILVIAENKLDKKIIGISIINSILIQQDVKKNKKSKTKQKKNIWEIIWFTIQEKYRSNNIGNKMISYIYNLANRHEIYSLIIESCLDALLYWITRKLPLIKIILSNKKYIDLNRYFKNKNEIFYTRFLNHFTDTTYKNLKSGFENKFMINEFPNLLFEELYNDKIIKNKKNKIIKSSYFIGKPYRFNINNSYHIILPINVSFIKKLEKEFLLLHNI